MSWNYRVFRKTFRRPRLNPDMKETEYTFDVREAYYSRVRGRMRVQRWSSEAQAPVGTSPDELVEILELMLRDVRKSKLSVLDAETGKPVKAEGRGR